MNKNKKERMAYVDMDDNDPRSDVEYNHVEENEVDFAELKPEPPYVCKLLTLSNRKNHSLKRVTNYPRKPIFSMWPTVMRSYIYCLQMAKC